MQTFLPYADFKKSAECLDYRRLGKQRVEAKQIIDLIVKHEIGIDISKLPWGNHPVVKMWINHLDLLMYYHDIIIEEWIKRGYKNNMKLFGYKEPIIVDSKPSWLGRKDFHDAHKSNLLRKDYEYYKQFGWDVPLDLKYVWK